MHEVYPDDARLLQEPADARTVRVALFRHLQSCPQKHKGIDSQTPAQAAGIEEKRWTLLDVVVMTDAYFKEKEDAAFITALEKAGL